METLPTMPGMSMAPAREHVQLVRDAGPGAVHQVEHGHLQAQGHFLDADDLFNSPGAPAAGLDGAGFAEQPAEQLQDAQSPEQPEQPVRNERFKWYILHAYSGFERKVRESIESRRGPTQGRMEGSLSLEATP